MMEVDSFKTLCKDMLNAMWAHCYHQTGGPVRFLPIAQIFPGPHMSHTWTHTHTRSCKNTQAPLSLGICRLVLHRVTHNPKCLLSQPTVFRGTSLPTFYSLPETPGALPKHPEVLKVMLLLTGEIAAGLGWSVWLEHVMGSESWRLMPPSLQTHF